MSNTEIVEQFYSAFSKLDFQTLSKYLSQDVVYYDPLWGLLEGDLVFYLWQMKCESLSYFSFQYHDIEELDSEYITCKWETRFFYKKSGTHVKMNGKAYMRINNGLITEHSDGYKLSDWLAATRGWKGKLLGWTGYMKRKEESIHREQLERYIKNKSLFTSSGRRSHDYDFSDR